MKTTKVVVVGAGLGGLRTVESLRRRGFQGDITLVGGEQHLPYDRPPLTKQVLRGERGMPSLREQYESLEVEILLGRRVSSLDSARRMLIIDDAPEIDYDALVLAPGAQPRWLPGVTPRPGLHVLRTIEDSLKLRAAITDEKTITVVGAGFIGCEAAASARTLGAEVTLIEASAAPLIRIVGAAAAAEIVAMHERNGVNLITNTGVEEVTGIDHVEGLILSDGRRIAATEVVLGLGVLPDTAWLVGSGVAVDNGIVCTDSGRTSVPDVYAVGDAARWWHPLAGEHRRIEHWTSAGTQADVVAANLVAVTDEEHIHLSDVPYFWSDQYDQKIQALGFIDAAAGVEVLSPRGRMVVVYCRDGTITGVVGFSAARSVMRLRQLIADRASVGAALDLLAE